ncbi:hypothetical protein KBD59_00680 [Candidatus Gracilibacteria bacterium]|nr:hypothetical protein [Candidatus Gracilibacteria bacterium]
MRLSSLHVDPVTSTPTKKTLELLKKKKTEILKYAFAQLPHGSHTELKKQLSAYKNIPHLCIVGLGGSSLGTKMLFQALDTQEVTFLDNVDPFFVRQQLAQLKKRSKETLFLCISKSGETIEVTSLFHILWKQFGSSSQFMIITDEPGSTLGKLAAQYALPVFTSPHDVPGRFSILSSVGIIPALLKKINVIELLEGAQNASYDIAARIAAHQYTHAISGRRIIPVFTYAQRLSSFVDWYIQLLAESIGKTTEIGFTPLKAMGVKDQHAQLQLFLDGPDDKFTIFIKPIPDEPSIPVPTKNYSLNELFQYEYEGVVSAFKKRKRPCVEIALTTMNAKELGELILTVELSVACLGILYGIDFQNQPAVELSKNVTKKMLR